MPTTKRSGGRKKAKAAEVQEELPIAIEAAAERELFVGAARAVFDLMVESPADLTAGVAVQINLEGNGWGELLVHWVREMVAARQQRGYIFKKFMIHDLSKHRLSAEAWGEKVSAERAPQRREVRGVPYHRVSVEHDDAAGLWKASIGLEVVAQR